MLYLRSEGLGKELAMKSGIEWIMETSIVAALILSIAGCGGSSSVSSELSESNGGSSGGGTGISNTFSSPAEMGVGDILPIELADTTVSIDFSAVPTSERFILALGSYNSSGSGTSVQVATNIALPGDELAKAAVSIGEEAPDENDVFGPQEILSAWLRASEENLDIDENLAGVSVSMAKAAGIKAVSMGDTETFRVLSSLSSTSSYVDVVGEVRCVGSNVIFYVDTSVPASVLPNADVTTLCNEFNTVASNEQALLGSTSDINSDGKFAVLMTKQINRLGALGGGIITGYFYASDLYSRSSSNTVSNEREIIYTMVPDPEGEYGTAISNEFAMSNLLPAVLPHELQHAISYNRHVLVNGGSPEENWLNEGMSHLVEDLMGYGVENPSRYAMFLSSPSTYGVVTQSSPNLMERGAAYLFMRFLYEQASSGSAFLAALENTAERGVSNLETAFGGADNFNEFSEFMARWTIALVMTDRGISSDSRYVYRSRVQNSSTGNWEGVCLECDADDNRGTSLSGVNLNTYYGTHNPSIDASAAVFYNVSTLPERMQFTGTSGGGSFGALIRTQ